MTQEKVPHLAAAVKGNEKATTELNELLEMYTEAELKEVNEEGNKSDNRIDELEQEVEELEEEKMKGFHNRIPGIDGGIEWKATNLRSQQLMDALGEAITANGEAAVLAHLENLPRISFKIPMLKPLFTDTRAV